MKHVTRGGLYYRVVDPSWRDPFDTSYSKRNGGRWNEPNNFGVLYLNASIDVAAARARRNFEGEIATLYDLAPQQRPDLAVVKLTVARFVDAITNDGLRSLQLPVAYPKRVGHRRCQAIGLRAYARRENGIAYRSDVTWPETGEGEELALFDTSKRRARGRERLHFSKWYPTEMPRRRPQDLPLS